jgi:hypothetical protein
MDLIAQWSQTPNEACQDAVVDHLLAFHRWSYSLPTQPKLLVLDTRTRRWRSESNLRKPSGLMDWEALSELQNELINHESVVLVSPAPVFGVKLIEVVQKLFTMAGKPLLVGAENWMAHRGTANVILNIFAHTKTPKHFVILSGEVHYSFVYSIKQAHHVVSVCSTVLELVILNSTAKASHCWWNISATMMAYNLMLTGKQHPPIFADQ